jgi:hypothetical protein
MAVAFLEKGRSEPRTLVKLTLASGIFKFLSGDHATITDALPIVVSVGEVGQEKDLPTGKVTYGSTDVVFLDDQTIRDLVDGETFKNQKMEILIGTFDEAEGAFVKIFNGTMTKPKPFEGGVTVGAVDARGRTAEKLLRGRQIAGSISDMIINRHPLQIMLAILQEMLPAGQIDSTAFDPDLYDTGDRAISHWNTARAVHGSFDRRIVEPSNALDMLDELAMLMEGTVLVDVDGRVTFKIFDPSDSIVATLTPNDIGEVEQIDTYAGHSNDLIFMSGWRGKSAGDDVLVRVPSGARKAPRQGEYFHHWRKVDLDSLTKHEHPDGPALTSGVFQETFESKWVGVDSLLEFEHSDSAPTITVIGGWAGSFAGVQRILNGVSDGTVNYTLNATDRPGYLLVQFPVVELEDQTIMQYEVIKVDNATIDFLNEGHPSVDGDTDLVGIPIRVVFTVAAGGRGQFNTSPLTLPRNSLVTDMTIPIQWTERKLPRITNGLPIFQFAAGLEHIDRTLGDFIALPDQDIFLAEGEDGLSGVEKLEILSTSIRSTGDQAGITFTITPVENPALGNVDDILFRPRDFDDDGIFGPWDNDDGPMHDTYVEAGAEMFAPGGALIGIRRGRIVGSTGSIEVASPNGIPSIPTTATKDIYIFFDTHSRMFHRREVAISATAPVAARGQAIIGKVETDGAALQVGSPEDLRLGARILANPRAFGGVSGTMLNGAFGQRFRNPDRYPPEGVELSPMDAVWGAEGAVGNEVELSTAAANIQSGDASIKVITPGKGIDSKLYTVDPSIDYVADFNWTGSAVGGDASGIVEFLALDRRTVVQTTVAFNKLAASPTTFQADTVRLSPPSTARWARLRFKKGVSSGVGVFALIDRMDFKPLMDSFHMFLAVGHTAASAVPTKIIFDTFDNVGGGFGGAHNIGSRASVFVGIGGPPFFTARKDGEYQFEGEILHTGQGTHYSTAFLVYVNGAERKRFQTGPHGTDLFTASTVGATRILLAAGDLIEPYILHTTGSVETLITGANLSWFSGRQVA